MTFHRTVLANGLRILTIPMPSLESATVMVMVGAGSRYENKKNNGISHFLEHMAFKGTQKRPTAMDISALIDGMGGEFNAFTGKEVTGFYIKSSADNAETSIDVLSDMLQNSKLDKEEIEKEKGVIIEEINLYEDTPSRHIGDIFERLLYGDTPMGWDTAGEKDVIKAITRENFVSYMKSLYSAANMTIVIAGGITTDKAVALAQKYFGKMPKFETIKHDKVEEAQKKPGFLLKFKKTEQSHLAIGFRTVPIDHRDQYPLSILAAILGGGMSSRLFHEVREKRGLAYYVRTNSEHYEDAGNLTTYAGVDPKRAEDAVKVIVEQYKKMITEPQISEQELKKAKEYLKGHLVLELEDSRSVSGFYAQQEILEKEIKNPDKIMKEIDDVTIEKVEEIAKRYFAESGLNMAIIGNFESGQNFEKLLKL